MIVDAWKGSTTIVTKAPDGFAADRVHVEPPSLDAKSVVPTTMKVGKETAASAAYSRPDVWGSRANAVTDSSLNGSAGSSSVQCAPPSVLLPRIPE